MLYFFAHSGVFDFASFLLPLLCLLLEGGVTAPPEINIFTTVSDGDAERMLPLLAPAVESTSWLGVVGTKRLLISFRQPFQCQVNHLQ